MQIDAGQVMLRAAQIYSDLKRSQGYEFKGLLQIKGDQNRAIVEAIVELINEIFSPPEEKQALIGFTVAQKESEDDDEFED